MYGYDHRSIVQRWYDRRSLPARSLITGTILLSLPALALAALIGAAQLVTWWDDYVPPHPISCITTTNGVIVCGEAQ